MNWDNGKTCWRTADPGRRRGLTLIELLIVLVVLVALGGLLVPIFGNLGADAREQATRATLARVAQAIVGAGGYEQAMRYARDADDVAFGFATGLPWPGPDEIGTGARQNHPQLHYLFRAPVHDATPDPDELLDYDPVSRVGWRGAWLDATNATTYEVNAADGFTDFYGLDGDLAPLDAFGSRDKPIRPIVIQLPNVTIAGLTPEQEFQEEARHVRLVSAGPDGVLDTPVDELTPSKTQKNDDLVLYLYREDPNP